MKPGGMTGAIGIGLLAFMVWGCQSPPTLGTNVQQPYLWESLPHHPQFAWHRHSPDSARVYVTLPAFEPLHLRENRNQPFRYSLQLELVVEPIEVPNDSARARPEWAQLRFDWNGEAREGKQTLTEQFTFPLPQGRYRITHTLRDQHRGSAVAGAILLDGWSQDAPIRALAFNAETGQPAWDRNLTAGSPLGLLVPPDLCTGPWSLSVLPPVDSFPSAPFLDRTPAEIRFPEPELTLLPQTEPLPDLSLPPGDWTGWGVLLWEGALGVHRWSLPASARQLVIPVRRPHFPVMRDLDEMMRATRYIATRDEYVAMKEARDPKRALDNFWLQFAGNPREARELIRTYYGRVLDANVHFSGLREGWRTDRGMVHVVFGHPDITRNDRFGETWVYGEDGDVNALIFRFSASRSGDDFNLYELERYPGFRSPWEAMVSSWRRGKIRKR